jgi:DNA modification methylase
MTKKQNKPFNDMFTDNSEYQLHLGDCVKTMHDLIPDNCMDLSVFSPPFSSLYSYSSHIEDMGNSRDSDDEFLLHFEFSVFELFRIMKPGTNTCIHLSDVPRLKEHHGYIGFYDLSGDVIRIMIKYGFIPYRRWTINKNPQSQSIRTHTSTLSFTQFEKDSMQSSAGLPDYLIVFKKPGEHKQIKPEATRNEWIEWANPTWYGAHESVICPNCKQTIIKGISETDTLNVRSARVEQDERHICPLQLQLIDRVVRLYSEKGDIVFTPFNQAEINCKRAVKLRDEQMEMFKKTDMSGDSNATGE